MTKRKQTKNGKVQAMLRRPLVASLEAICKATGWQAHSVRAALSTLRKTGVAIERRDSETGTGATYHLLDKPGDQA